MDNPKLMKSLGFGLDESAAETVINEWRFQPGTRDGVPVDVIADIEVPFRLAE